MKLYLVQHGEAIPKEKDPARPLSAKGKADMERMASFLARSGVRAAKVIHSGKRRARDTAVILAGPLGPGVVEEAAFGLAPNDSTDRLAEAAADWNEDAMVVGHLPFMGRMVALLTCGDEAAAAVQFEPGTVACLERRENGSAWTLAWMVRPSLLGG